jgi:hypothetical protein
MRRLLTVGLLSLALMVVGASRAKAGGYTYGYTCQSSAHFSFNFVPYCIPNCPKPYDSCAYAPYFQYGWPHSFPVYPGVEPGFGFAPTPWVLPASASGVNPACPAAPAYWNPR